MNNLLDNIIATSFGRRFSKTTAICKAAKEIGATVICANLEQATIVSLEHEVKTASIHQNLRGTIGPYLYDHFAIERTVLELKDYYEKEINKVHYQLNQTRNEFKQLDLQHDDLQIQYQELLIENFKLKEKSKRKKRKNVRK